VNRGSDALKKWGGVSDREETMSQQVQPATKEFLLEMLAYIY